MTTPIQVREYTTWMSLKTTAPRLCATIRSLIETGQTPDQIRAQLSKDFNSDFMRESIFNAASYVYRKRSGGDHGDL